MAPEVVQRVTCPGRSPLRQATERGLALFGQSYTGDIDIHPRFRLELLRKVAVNPTRADLAAFIREGRNAVCVLARIRDQTRIERTFQHCVSTLERRVMASGWSVEERYKLPLRRSASMMATE